MEINNGSPHASRRDFGSERWLPEIAAGNRAYFCIRYFWHCLMIEHETLSSNKCLRPNNPTLQIYIALVYLLSTLIADEIFNSLYYIYIYFFYIFLFIYLFMFLLKNTENYHRAIPLG